ncbi:MAG: bi-domain-containing oxidoreductase [Nitrospirales bacterium]|nr:bi-domain-containing oxidoreductase [Nitrospirales bacterium]
MKQVTQNYKTGELKVDNVPAPSVMRKGLLVENRCSLISAGTEKSTVDMARKSLVGKARARPDLVRKVIRQVQKDGLINTAKMVMGRLDTRAALGYTCAGIVSEVGEEVEGFSRGDRVACAGQGYASHAEIVSIPKNLCIKIPNGVNFEDASYVAVGSIALQGVRQADPKLGEAVAVIGLGLIGQITVQMLKANGCEVIASDLDPKKLELAIELGADRAVCTDEFVLASSAATAGYGVDSVIITASTKSSEPIEIAGEICRKKGRVVVVGAVGLVVPREPYYVKELELRLSCSYGPGRYDTEYEENGQDYPYGYVRWTEQRNMSAFLNLIAEKKLNLKTLTTHTFAIDDANQAYDMISNQTESYLGVVLKYPSESLERFSQRIDLATLSVKGAIHFGLIGVGNHIKDMLLPLIRKNKAVTIKAVCASTGINAKAVAEQEKAEYCASNFHEILADADINAVVVGTRHDTHAEIIIAALRQGKHVFVEKPLCMTTQQLEEIEEVYAEAASRGLILQVGFNRRYSAHAERIKGFFEPRNNPLTMMYRVNAGAISAEHWIQDYKIGGGRIIGEACHFIDFMQYIAGANPSTVFSFDVDTHNSGITNDKAVILLRFGDGSIGTLIYCGDGDKSLAKERFEAFADGKSVVLNDFSSTELYSGGSQEVFRTKRVDKGFAREMECFISGITDGEISPTLFMEARATTLATIKALQSMSSRYCEELHS